MNKAQSPELEAFKNSVGMTVTLISFGMLFATLFLGYFLVRFNSPTWPPVEIQGMPKLLPFLSTLIMALSSVSYFFFEKRDTQRKLWWSVTLILGFGFLLLQWGLWATLKETGILISNGMVPSMVYAFTWLHAGHIVLGILGLLWIGFFVFFKTDKLSVLKVLNIGKFWHFLGVVWLLMYLFLFVL
jgi:cytochrome c oxidase subunit III